MERGTVDLGPRRTRGVYARVDTGVRPSGAVLLYSNAHRGGTSGGFRFGNVVIYCNILCNTGTGVQVRVFWNFSVNFNFGKTFEKKKLILFLSLQMVCIQINLQTIQEMHVFERSCPTIQ